MQAVVWSDYLCPWCYAGLDRSARLEEMGVRVTPRPYELHPDIPPEGWPVKERGRRLYERIAEECRAAGMPLARPDRIPNSRRALGTSEWVRVHQPEAHPRLHRSLFDAVFVEGAPIDDPAVIDALVAAAGADAKACRRALDAGAMESALATSRGEAIDAGVSGTPAWWLDGRLLIPGLQPPEFYERMVARLRARPKPA